MLIMNPLGDSRMDTCNRARRDARLDVLQSASGAVLALFLCIHLFLVA